MVTVREQLPAQLADLSDEMLKQHSLDILLFWLERIRKDGKPLHKLEEVGRYILEKLHQNDSDFNIFIMGIEMADILEHLKVDEETLMTAMLYRSVRSGLISLDEIQQKFGDAVAGLMKGTLAMGKLSELIEKNKRLEDHFNNNQREHLTGIYKMLLSVTEDVRVVLIKLADRTYTLRELAHSGRERQERVAREILTIYAPLAHRLGIAQLKWELEDLAFRYLAPERYKEIAGLLNEKRLEREQYIQNVQDTVRTALADYGINAEISGRVKHIYSIYRKMKSKNLSFEQLYDIRALRILVDTVPECYHALGIVHVLWRHIPSQFDDYITNPKPNGYRSLHTAVIAENKSLEIQIRTREMHDEAELGVCSHFNYKEGAKNNDESFNNRLHSLRAVLEMYQERTDNNLNQDSEDSQFQAVQNFEDFEKIYVFSRDGDIKELPRDATVLDFAYYLHTEVGNHCYAARVNQRYVPLTYRLKTGEQVEILTKKDRTPNRDWLINSLGYLRTDRAKEKLRHWFRQQDRSNNLETGREILNKELARLAIHPKSIDLNDYCEHFHLKTGEDILIGLVNGDVGIHALLNQINKQMNADDEPELVLQPMLDPKATQALSDHGILIDGLDNVELSVARCCQPVHGESIGGYITQHRGVSIHKINCPDYLRMISLEPARMVEASWQMQPSRGQSVQIVIDAYDRRGLLKDLTQVIFSDHINIRQVNTISEADGIANMKLLIEVKGLAQLSKLLARLEQQPGIISAKRLVQNPVS